MDHASYFIKDKALFGSFPTQTGVDELEECGVRVFVNLTFDTEKKITPYKTNHKYISFPIVDRQVPKDWKKFASFIIYVTDLIRNLENGDLIYIHCKGGHGRSGVVVASILCHYYGMTSDEALKHTTKSHSSRSIMRERWRELGSPQTYYQKNFVHKFFNSIYFFRAYNVGHTAGFSNFTNHPVFIDDFGLFPTSEAAIQAYKNPSDKQYVSKQMQSKSPIISNTLGKKVMRDDWLEVCDKILYKVLKAKFDMHEYIRCNLLNTGLRPIIYHTFRDFILGDGGDGSGKNKLGKTLMKIREEYYREFTT